MADKTNKPADDKQAKADLAEFQKLVKYEDRKKFWQEHPSIHEFVSETNFHA